MMKLVNMLDLGSSAARLVSFLKIILKELALADCVIPSCISCQLSDKKTVIAIYQFQKLVPYLCTGFVGFDEPCGLCHMSPSTVVLNGFVQRVIIPTRLPQVILDDFRRYWLSSLSQRVLTPRNCL